jgi:hypothetical protein
MIECYRLDPDHTAVRCTFDEMVLWKSWVGEAGIRVALDDVGKHVCVSTVFLGTNHNFAREGPPILFETMIFGGKLDESQWRCSTWDQAVEQHNAAVLIARYGGLKVVNGDKK